MRYYIDFEFDDRTLTPISIGIASQDGRELYMVDPNADITIRDSLNRKWLTENVLKTLSPQVKVDDRTGMANLWTLMKEGTSWVRGASQWRDQINEFIGEDQYPEFWGYFSDYDWVIFCRLYGAMIDLPKHFPKFCLDLKQVALSLGIVVSLKERVPMKDEHNALADAKWMRTVHSMMIVQYGRSV